MLYFLIVGAGVVSTVGINGSTKETLPFWLFVAIFVISAFMLVFTMAHNKMRDDASKQQTADYEQELQAQKTTLDLAHDKALTAVKSELEASRQALGNQTYSMLKALTDILMVTRANGVITIRSNLADNWYLGTDNKDVWMHGICQQEAVFPSIPQYLNWPHQMIWKHVCISIGSGQDEHVLVHNGKVQPLPDTSTTGEQS